MLRLTARSIKCTFIVTPDQLAGFAVPNGSGSVPFVIEIGHRRVSGQFNPKTLRKAIALAAQGIGKAVAIQGNLTETNTLEGAGISVPTPPPAPKVAAAAD